MWFKVVFSYFIFQFDFIMTKKFINYFLQGLFIVGPISITIAALLWLFNKIDNIIPINDITERFFNFSAPGIGFILFISLIIMIGYFSTNFFLNKIIGVMEKLINRSKFLKFVYGSIKDLIGAFAGEQKRFDTPVLVTIDKTNQIQRMGFITQSDLEDIGAVNKVAVYCPMSYSFAGDLLIVPKENVTIVSGITAAEAMKFIVSGGVTKLDD
ncbi:MAG: hypothetical protein RJA07_1729 [Bacteroidota bacterium]